MVLSCKCCLKKYNRYLWGTTPITRLYEKGIAYLLLTWDAIHLGVVAPASIATTASQTAAAQAPGSYAQAIPIAIQSWFHHRRP